LGGSPLTNARLDVTRNPEAFEVKYQRHSINIDKEELK
jgi:hypothetical protein